MKIQKERGKPQEKEINVMRLIHYYVINKETNEKVYTDCREVKAKEFLANLSDKENYRIGYKWVSI